jgi:hypothetical protein
VHSFRLLSKFRGGRTGAGVTLCSRPRLGLPDELSQLVEEHSRTAAQRRLGGPRAAELFDPFEPCQNPVCLVHLLTVPGDSTHVCAGFVPVPKT